MTKEAMSSFVGPASGELQRTDGPLAGGDWNLSALLLAANWTNLSAMFDHPWNASDDGQEDFFDVYYTKPRFILETLIAISACLVNAVSLVALVGGRVSQLSVYSILFFNLAVSNVLNSALSWLANNILYIFKDQVFELILSGVAYCQLFVYLVAAVFTCTAFGIVNTLTILGFSTVQYFAICRPFQHLSIVRRRRVYGFIMISWIVTSLCAVVPFVALLGVSRLTHCSTMAAVVMSVVTLGSNVSMGIIYFIFLAIIVLCCRIYVHIRFQRTAELHLDFRSEHEVTNARRAFVTTVILLTSLMLLYIPYNVIYILSLNREFNVGYSSLLIYFMNFFPYFKCLADPVIYGLRMRELRLGFYKLAFSARQWPHRLRHICLKSPTSGDRGRAPGYTMEKRAGSRQSSTSITRLSSYRYSTHKQQFHFQLQERTRSDANVKNGDSGGSRTSGYKRVASVADTRTLSCTEL